MLSPVTNINISKKYISAIPYYTGNGTFLPHDNVLTEQSQVVSVDYKFVPSFKAALLQRMQLFKSVAMNESNPNWQNAVSRQFPLEDVHQDWRTPFDRDKNRIMNSEGYDRLRYKTQVFPVPENDMVSTRSSHVLQVVDTARTISKQLGLNEELAEAIAQGHDIGHAPFGHDGERVLKKITQANGLPVFWHEKNGLRMVEKFNLYSDSKGNIRNLNLTYAVRDGIINHCGEVDENGLKPRKEFIDLDGLQKPAEVQPYTWEGIVVKISDKIAYLGRDIEDAMRIGVISQKNLDDLKSIIQSIKPDFDDEVNNTTLTNLFINDIIQNSSLVKGIGFSEPVSRIMDAVKDYNTKNIYYRNDVRTVSKEKCEKVLNTIFNFYSSMYRGSQTIDMLPANDRYINNFRDWLVAYSDTKYRTPHQKNEIIYHLENPKDYLQAVVDYMSGMTDKFALSTYNHITGTTV